MICLSIALVILMCLWIPTGASASARDAEQGILWPVPAGIEPDFTLAHPRVFYTQEDVARAHANLAPGGPDWGQAVLHEVIQAANRVQMSDYQVRQLMPKPYSYYMYLDDFKVCPDGSPMKWAGLDNPGKVICGGKLLPDAEHPDDGRGWTDGKGNSYYFVARWNGAYVDQLTAILEPLALAYTLSGNQEYAHKAAVILDALATIYPTAIEGPLDYPGLRPGYEGGRLARPLYRAARELLRYVNATDLIWNSGELDTPSATNPALSTRDNIVYNLLLNGADYCYRQAHTSGYVDQLHNGTADFNKGLLATGSLLGIDMYVDWAVNGPTSLAVMLANNIDRDGLYYETTSGYTKSVRTLYMEIAEMLYKLGTPRFPAGINMFDHPRFAALYKDSRELLFVAGRIPAYGDTRSDEAINVGKPFDADEVKQLLRFAIRASAESKRQEYWELVTGIARTPAMAAQDVWGIFNVGSMPAVTGTAVQTVRPSEVAGGSGFALLRAGTDRGAMLRYGPTLNHGNYDELGLHFYTNGREMSFDPGYPNAHYRVGFAYQTVAHVAGIVDEKSQLSAASAGGSLQFVTAAPGFSATEASDPGAYSHLGVSTYRRLVALTDTAPDKSYIVDIFRIDGGTGRDYSFHARGAQFTVAGLTLGAPQPGSVASSDYTWHNQIGQDDKIIPYRDKDFYWNPPPGNGYGFLGNPQVARTDGVWSAAWAGVGAKVRLTMLPAPGREVVVAAAPSPTGNLKYVLARDRGNQPSQYAAVIDMTGADFQVAQAEPLTLLSSPAGGMSPVAFALTLAEPKLPAAQAATQVRDIYLSSLSGQFTAATGDTSLVTDAELAMVRMYDAEPAELHVIKGTGLSAGELSVAGFPAEYKGQIVTVDYQNNSILVSAATPIPDGVVGEYVLISASAYSHNSPYRISRITKEDPYYRLYLAADFSLAKGTVVGSPQGNVLPNGTDLPYARNVTRTGPSSFYNGKLVVNEKGMQAQIKQVQSNYAGLVVDNAAGFDAGDNLTIYDVKAGDEFAIPVAVHLVRVDGITYELCSPQPVWLTVPAKFAKHVYVATADGSFTAAQKEERNGAVWFRVPAGPLVLGRAAVLKAEPNIQANGNAPKMPELDVTVLDVEKNAPVGGAVVTTYIGGALLPFSEVGPGLYRTTLPAGLLIGVYQLEIAAAKEGLAIEPIVVTLDVQADWQITTASAVMVPLGDRHTEINASVLAGDRLESDIVVTVRTGGKTIPMAGAGGGLYTAVVEIESKSAYRNVVLRAEKTGGFAREVTVPIIYERGQIILPSTEVQAQAGAPIAVPVSFKGADGRLLRGGAIPYAQIYQGIFNSAVFFDEDGDGVATAILKAPGQPGTYTATIQAEGCDDAQVKLVVSN